MIKLGDKVIIRDYEYWGVNGIVTDIVNVELLNGKMGIRYEVSMTCLDINGNPKVISYNYREEELELTDIPMELLESLLKEK